jgi:histidyl-tRNA synthetase
MNFKGVETLWEKFEKFSKILTWLGHHKSDFSWAHLYARNLSFYTSVKWLGLNKRKEFEFEIQTSQHL